MVTYSAWDNNRPPLDLRDNKNTGCLKKIPFGGAFFENVFSPKGAKKNSQNGMWGSLGVRGWVGFRV